MSYWVFTINCTVIARTTMQRVTSLEMQATHMKERTQAFDEATKANFKDSEHTILEGARHNPTIGMVTHLRRTQTFLRNSMR